jgi:hypothetical protein
VASTRGKLSSRWQECLGNGSAALAIPHGGEDVDVIGLEAELLLVHSERDGWQILDLLAQFLLFNLDKFIIFFGKGKEKRHGDLWAVWLGVLPNQPAFGHQLERSIGDAIYRRSILSCRILLHVLHVVSLTEK